MFAEELSEFKSAQRANTKKSVQATEILGPCDYIADLDAPNGELWFYTASFEYEEIPPHDDIAYTDRILREYEFTIYNTNNEVVGSIKDRIDYRENEVRLPKTINTTICYPQFNPNERYLLYTALVAGGYMALPSDKNIYIAMDNAGVDNITADNALSLNYDRNSHELKAVAASGVVSLSAYSVSGGLIGLTNGERNSTVTLSLDGAPQGIIVARAVDALGNTKTIKIAR